MRITTHTELPPCCVCVHADNSTVFLGTYKLEDDGTRHGSIDVMRLDGETLTLTSRYPTESAVLDIKFSPFDTRMLVSAHSTGLIRVWRYKDSELVVEQDLQLFDTETLVTSLFFSPSQEGKLLATLTSGESGIVDLRTGTYEPFPTNHDLECWTGSFGESGELAHVTYTGGDDGKVIAHDLRTNDKIWATTMRQHEAGVVSILSSGPQWNLQNPHQLWTGSYDDNLRIFDLRLMDKLNPSLLPGYIPRVAKQENLGGGVWRLIPSPVENDDTLLACCMYDGARIIDVKQDDDFEVTKYFKGAHESMCYGGSWGVSGEFVVTCSFYDKVVEVWEPTKVN
ncbi:WD40 repeat-like protein [Suhomyces tanzawaensis NRRL Y-17324]|uniref:methylated diphthine methylhydrolase n=1 Tax=Suhomyces tanzawaensis NRRL Y-17324 TaxID=984487 RepID=A0A1E4SR66_9ASCO|nr:WD40 repeat-like protein [Suhomyces tanzawaensis NRRL Y-17324]ODV81994.1 WD40 repeat-like protein [Suhomyces tanzawaensis NRRL Y-17324]